MKRLRVLAAVAGAAVLLTGLVGFAHTKRGRPLLAWLGKTTAGSGCPLGYGANDAESRRKALEKVRGDKLAAARPALGFVLDVTTKADVLRWASEHGVLCDEHHGQMTCHDVPAGALSNDAAHVPVSSLFLDFDDHRRLVSVSTVRRMTDAREAAASQRAAVADVSARAGAAASSSGEATPEWLEKGLLRQARAELRFLDYHATIAVTNMSPSFVLTELYESIPTS